MAKFTCRVIQDNNGKYHADLCIAGHMVEGLPSCVDYNTLREAIRRTTGIEILKRSAMIFERYNGKSYAMIDATQTRKDCRVTIEEILNGWKPDFSVNNEVVLSKDDKAVLTAVDSALVMYGADEIRVVADYDTGMINVEIIEQGEWMNRVAAIESCNLHALEEFLDYRWVEHDLRKYEFNESENLNHDNENVLSVVDAALVLYGSGELSVDRNDDDMIDVNICSRHDSQSYMCSVARYNKCDLEKLKAELDKRNVGYCM